MYIDEKVSTTQGKYATSCYSMQGSCSLSVASIETEGVISICSTPVMAFNWRAASFFPFLSSLCLCWH